MSGLRARICGATALALLLGGAMAQRAPAQIEFLTPPGQELDREAAQAQAQEEAQGVGEDGTVLPNGEAAPEEGEEPGPLPGEVNSLFRLRRPGDPLPNAETPPEGEEGEGAAGLEGEPPAEGGDPDALPDPVFTRPESHTLAGDLAVLRVLDKMSGGVSDVEIPVGETVTRERLELSVKACRTEPPELPDDSFAWVTVRDLREEAPRFDGWMIASAPSVNALDHQRYDVWVLSCKIRSAGVSDGSAKKFD